MPSASSPNITSVLKETRQFPPPAAFAAEAHVKSLAEYEKLYERAAKDPEGFWAEQAESLTWFKKWNKVLEWKEPFAKWFLGGKINACFNCVDRHLAGPRKNKAAIIWEGEPGDSRVLRYQDLHREVCKFANVLKGQGIKPGDRVTIYMPMVPELAIAMLACARIGATHSIIFGGFSAEAVADRNNDAKAKLVITADGGWRRGKVVPLKQNVDGALDKSPTVEKCIVYNRCNQQVNMKPGRDLWWHELMATASADCPAEPFDSEHPLYILYTSGSTGKPKGVLHTTAGYLLGVSYTHRLVFDLKEEDTYWCTADIGWVTGHSYIVYGPLANGATTLMYEGAPNHPREDRFWEIIEKYRVNTFYTAPTAIRAFTKWGDKWPKIARFVQPATAGNRRRADQSGSVDLVQRSNRRQTLSHRRYLVADRNGHDHDFALARRDRDQARLGDPAHSWRSGGNRRSPGPRTACQPGRPVGHPETLARDAPHRLRRRRTLSHAILVAGAARLFHRRRRPQGPGRLLLDHGPRGRRPQRLRPPPQHHGSGKSPWSHHEKVAEAAVVGKPDDIKGEGISCFVTLVGGEIPTDELKKELQAHVVKEIGSLARPDEIRFTESLPKTRSGKIMRRLLRDIASGRQTTGDTTTLEDYSVLAKLREEEE